MTLGLLQCNLCHLVGCLPFKASLDSADPLLELGLGGEARLARSKFHAYLEDL